MSPATSAPVAEALKLEGVSVALSRRNGQVPILREVSFTVAPGEVVGLVGESGCGKSLTALTVLGLSPPVMKVTAGRVLIQGQDVLRAARRELQAIRGLRVGMIFPDPASALDPLMRVGAQVEEPLAVHHLGTPPERRLRVEELLGYLGFRDRLHVGRRYPHELSGGMQQRIAIAGALAARPGLIVADEPTTALDAAMRSQILRLLVNERANGTTGVLVISHDIGAVGQVADRMIVMYGGRVVEAAPASELLSHPRHRYTKALMDIFAARHRRAMDDSDLPTIPGHVPSPGEVDAGCPFAPRCVAAVPKCREVMPPHEAAGAAHSVACWNPVPAVVHMDVAFGDEPAGRSVPPTLASIDEAAQRRVGGSAPAPGRDPLLVFASVSKSYGGKGFGSRRAPIEALSRVSLSVAEGEVLGIVGETGSGKSTLGRLALGLERPTDGSVSFRGLALDRLGPRRLRALRKEIQPVWQDPYGALNPRMRVDEIIAEPYIVHEHLSGSEARKRAGPLLQMVGLDAAMGRRYPHEFSSGQRQRIVIARAIALSPKFLVCDEPLAALDISVQAKILNLLRRLQMDLGLTYLFISHDLWATRLIATRIAVLYRGRLVELGPASAVMERPAHAYTQKLVAADSLAKQEWQATPESAESDTEPGEEVPGWRQVGPEHWAASHQVALSSVAPTDGT